MHSWGLYNGRYRLSDHVLIKKFPEPERQRPIAERMLDGELATEKIESRDRQGREAGGALDKTKLFRNYKQLQFVDTLRRAFAASLSRPEKRWPKG